MGEPVKENCCYESVKKLREINDLIDSQEVKLVKERGTILYEGWQVRSLFQAQDKSLTVGDCVISRSGVFPKHYHKESLELFIVKKGKLTVKFLDEDREVTVSDKDDRNFIYVKAGSEHSISADEGSILLFILIPSDKGFPDYGTDR